MALGQPRSEGARAKKRKSDRGSASDNIRKHGHGSKTFFT